MIVGMFSIYKNPKVCVVTGANSGIGKVSQHNLKVSGFLASPFPTRILASKPTY